MTLSKELYISLYRLFENIINSDLPANKPQPHTSILVHSAYKMIRCFLSILMKLNYIFILISDEKHYIPIGQYDGTFSDTNAQVCN